MITISNDNLIAKFSNIGAELKSLVYKNTDYIWHGDEKFWNNSSPVLFPICGGLKDNTYFYENKYYNLNKHGYAMHSEFTVEEIEQSKITFLLKSDEESRKVYPFDYELRIDYILINNKIEVVYRVKNLSAKTMYFSIGAHEGYACPEGIEEYDIILPKAQDLYSCEGVEHLLSDSKIELARNTNVLPLKYKYFNESTLIFDDIQSTSVVLKNRNNGRGIKLDFAGFDYFLIWSLKDAPFVCLEPWCGITDTCNTNQNLIQKRGIQALNPNDEFVRKHYIEFF